MNYTGNMINKYPASLKLISSVVNHTAVDETILGKAEKKIVEENKPESGS